MASVVALSSEHVPPEHVPSPTHAAVSAPVLVHVATVQVPGVSSARHAASVVTVSSSHTPFVPSTQVACVTARMSEHVPDEQNPGAIQVVSSAVSENSEQ
jgi:hypothetical protein